MIKSTISYQIDAFWDAEVKVWVATSEDVVGLATEADTIEDLTDKLRLIVPELISYNRQISDNYAGAITFELISHRQELIEVA